MVFAGPKYTRRRGWPASRFKKLRGLGGRSCHYSQGRPGRASCPTSLEASPVLRCRLGTARARGAHPRETGGERSRGAGERTRTRRRRTLVRALTGYGHGGPVLSAIRASVRRRCWIAVLLAVADARAAGRPAAPRVLAHDRPLGAACRGARLGTAAGRGPARNSSEEAWKLVHAVRLGRQTVTAVYWFVERVFP